MADDEASEETEHRWLRRGTDPVHRRPRWQRGRRHGPVGLDGAKYEIDLNAEHAQALRDALARYVGAAREAGSGTPRPARSGRRAQADGVDSTEVREWAKAQGIEVKDRGRVPAELMVKFKAATGQ